MEVITHALKALLQLSYEDTISGVNKIGYNSYTIKLNDEINKVRDKAIELLLKFFKSANTQIIMNGIEIVSSVGNAGIVGISKYDKLGFDSS